MKRLTARKVSIEDMDSGSYVVKDGTTPNYIDTPRGPVSRANLIAAVVDKPGGSAVLLDDGSGTMEARAFDDSQLFSNILVGDIILLIGRPREYQGRRYLVAEIAKRLGAPAWLRFRKAELERAPKTEAPAPRPAAVKAEEQVASTGDAVLVLVKELDDGSGAPIEAVIEKSGDKETERVLTDLMADGEIFEIRPGRVKVLE